MLFVCNLFSALFLAAPIEKTDVGSEQQLLLLLLLSGRRREEFKFVWHDVIFLHTAYLLCFCLRIFIAMQKFELFWAPKYIVWAFFKKYPYQHKMEPKMKPCRNTYKRVLQVQGWVQYYVPRCCTESAQNSSNFGIAMKILRQKQSKYTR